jgi:ribosome-associated protein
MSDDALDLGHGVRIPVDEVSLRASRSSGPGGQHANVTASRIEAVFDIDASPTLTDEQKRRLRARFGPRVTAVAQDARSQLRNRELAVARLNERVAAALRPRKRRRATRATKASQERRLQGKRKRSDVKRARRRPSAEE